MKFKCKTSNLREAVSKVERIVSKHITLPILANIHISTEKGMLALSATNLEIAVKVYIGAKIEQEGEITVPARIISGFLVNVKDDTISGNLQKLQLEIKSKSHKIKINGMDPKDFPVIPSKMPANFFSVEADDILLKKISSVLISVAHNDTRQELNGVLMSMKKDLLVLAATDSFRLSETKINLDERDISEEYLRFIDQNTSIIVPFLTLSELQKLISGGRISFAIDQNQFFIGGSDFVIISRLINGNYPEYQQVLPQEYQIKVVVNREQLLEAIKIASLVANNQNSEVKIASQEGKKQLIMTAQSMDTGDNVSKIDAKIQGPEFEVIFNCRYLAEGLSSAIMSSDDIEIKLNPEKSPALLRPVNKDGAGMVDFSYVVMPIIKS